MKVLVTGSSGFIGSHLVNSLISNGHIVMGIDLVSPIDKYEGNYVFHQCDILDFDRLIEGFDNFQPECVIHLAARTDLDENAELIVDYNVNIDGVKNIVVASQKTDSVKRCIYTSTQLVCRPGYVPKDSTDWQPHTLYGESKVLGEKIIHNNDDTNVSWCIVRPTTVWGPGMNEHYQRFIRMVEDGRYFHVGDNLLYKSYGYVGNVIHQLLRIMSAPSENVNRRVFYLADYEPLSLKKWVDMLSDELGSGDIITIPIILARLGALVGDVVNKLGFSSFPFNTFRLQNVLTEYQVNTDDTEEICGDLPYDTELGVEATVKWYKSLK